jgi:hypothetical protein
MAMEFMLELEFELPQLDRKRAPARARMVAKIQKAVFRME